MREVKLNEKWKEDKIYNLGWWWLKRDMQHIIRSAPRHPSSIYPNWQCGSNILDYLKMILIEQMEENCPKYWHHYDIDLSTVFHQHFRALIESKALHSP